jgi:endonuclease/exonuclease/phosphatase family metal-dependent hydrolase/Icc-related predicted phosphoesterase
MAASPKKEANTLRLMSYNVHHFVGTDNQPGYERVANLINDICPDVVALQEVDSVTLRSNGVNSLRELADRTLMFPTFSAAIDFEGGKYGVGILSREKPLGVTRYALPGSEEARTLLLAEFDGYVVACTHFSLTEADRIASVAIINEAAAHTDKPLFLLGDMNSTPKSDVQQALNKNFRILNDPNRATIYEEGKGVCVDYIYQYKNSAPQASVLRREVVNDTVASDHCPLYADLRLPASADKVFRSKPFLQNPTGGGISVSWFTNVPTHGWVEYGTDPDRLDHKAETVVDGQVVCNDTHQKIRFGGLQPGQTYYYRVCSREILRYEAYKKEFGPTVTSKVYRFTMPSAEEKEFTAVVFNDLHRRTEVIDKLAEQLKDVNYDFVFFNGDCIDDAHTEEQAVSFLTHMAEKTHASEIPFFFLRGNHEIRDAYSIRLRSLIDYVGDKTYGAFNWGDTRFVLLDCGEDKPDSTWVYYGLNHFEQLRDDQVAFLTDELHSKAFKKAKRRVLLHHIPIYGEVDRYNPCRELWGTLLAKAPFDVCINAHTHRHAFLPKESVGNNFPIFVGGGPRISLATAIIIEKKGDSFRVKMIDAEGKTIREIACHPK